MKTSTILSFMLAMGLAISAHAQYCMLPGRTPYAAEQPGITTFKLNNINRVSGNIEGGMSAPPVVVTTDSTTLARGKTYTVTIIHSKDPVNFPTARNNIRVWIDYNSNFSFTDANETVISKDFETPGTTTATFTVPANAPLGITRLRATAKMSSDAGHSLPTPCDDPADGLGYHGEIEDYKVKIVQFPSGVEDMNYDTPVCSVYPNPATSDINLSLSNNQHKPLSASLYDVTGKLVANLLDEPVQSASMYHFDLGGYTSGVYFVKLTSGGTSFYQKIVKNN